MIPVRNYGRPISNGVMLRGLGTLLTFASVVFLPWPLTTLLALGLSPFEPFVPLAVGLFADTLYYTSSSATLPLFTLCGALATAGALFVRSRLLAGIIGE